MTEKKPIVLKNVRLSYPSIRRPSEDAPSRGPSVTITIPSKYSPFVHCWLMSSLMGGWVPAISALVGYDPQKLLPAPSPLNRPMSGWDADRFQLELQSLMNDIPRWGEQGSPFDDVERYRKEMTEPWPHKVAVIALAGLDFGLIEARVIAAMSDKRVRGVILDIESAGGEISNPQLDLYRMAFMEKPRAEKVAKKAPPAYLKHDPTKRHSRRRKGK